MGESFEAAVFLLEELGDIILKSQYGAYKEFKDPGTYTLEIPHKCNQIKISACGGGGGGASAYVDMERTGGGGGGGAAIFEQLVTVTPYSQILINVGKGGAGGGESDEFSYTGKNGENGTATIIEGVGGGTITLNGGYGGSVGTSTNQAGQGGVAGGAGGGAGGNGGIADKQQPTNGIAGVTGAGGKYATGNNSTSNGGGGGGSLGKGGDSIGPWNDTGTGAGYGGGGAGGGTTSDWGGHDGGDGYCKIEYVFAVF